MYLSVGEISKILGISTETIRHYVQEGIITPHKNTANNYWEYSSDDFIRLTDVLFYRSMGLSVKEIKTIMGGAPIEELGDIIKIRRAELIKIIKETVDMMQRLDDWEECYWSEIGLLGKYKIGPMPIEYRRANYISQDEHIANSLRRCFVLEREDWMCLSVSFYYHLNDKEKGLQKYFSFNENTRLKICNAKTGTIAEKADHCLITEVLFSDDAEAMFAPMIAYAEEQGIALTGEFYGREETNFYQNGKRLGLYKVYAPIRKKK